MGIIVLWVIMGALMIAGLIVFGVNRKRDNERTESEWDEGLTPRTWRRIGGYVALGAVVISAIFTGFSLFYNQGEGVANVRVAITGQVNGVTTEAGLQTKAPWDSVVEYDIRNQKVEMFSNDGGTGANGAAISAPLDGGANASISITVLYSITPAEVVNIYKQFGPQTALLGNALEPSLRDIVREMSAEYAPLAIKQERAALSNDIFEVLSEKWAEYGVIVVEVNLGDISLDPSTEEAIAAVITAQQRVEQARAELEQAQITAETTKTEAQASADADQIIRCGATVTTGTQLINGKETEVQIVTPKSNAECENRLNEQVLTTKWFETLRSIGAAGNMVVVIPEDGTAPIINLPAAR
jgi:regulator of protease activity HflC (stomatin/prohibitin superfamily)